MDAKSEARIYIQGASRPLYAFHEWSAHRRALCSIHTAPLDTRNIRPAAFDSELLETGEHVETLWNERSCRLRRATHTSISIPSFGSHRFLRQSTMPLARLGVRCHCGLFYFRSRCFCPKRSAARGWLSPDTRVPMDGVYKTGPHIQPSRAIRVIDAGKNIAVSDPNSEE